MLTENLHRKIKYANVDFLISRDCSIKPDLSGTLGIPLLFKRSTKSLIPG